MVRREGQILCLQNKNTMIRSHWKAIIQNVDKNWIQELDMDDRSVYLNDLNYPNKTHA